MTARRGRVAVRFLTSCGTTNALADFTTEEIMKSVRRSGAAAVIAALIIMSGMPGTARVEAAGKKGGSDGQTATCDYLRSIINYPNTSPYIKAWAISLYRSKGCQPPLP